MSMQSIRDYYQVPAKRGMRVIFDGQPGVITSADRSTMHLRVMLDDTKHSVRVHPTWHMEYLPTETA